MQCIKASQEKLDMILDLVSCFTFQVRTLSRPFACMQFFSISFMLVLHRSWKLFTLYLCCLLYHPCNRFTILLSYHYPIPYSLPYFSLSTSGVFSHKLIIVFPTIIIRGHTLEGALLLPPSSWIPQSKPLCKDPFLSHIVLCLCHELWSPSPGLFHPGLSL